MAICGTLKCENTSICEKTAKCEEMSTLNVKIDAICEENTLNVKCFIHLARHIFSHMASIFSHMASIFTISVDISSHPATFVHLETFTHLRVPHHLHLYMRLLTWLMAPSAII